MERDTYERSPHIAILETSKKNSLSEGAMKKVTWNPIFMKVKGYQGM